jgi:uracil-DNA glycosylase
VYAIKFRSRRNGYKKGLVFHSTKDIIKAITTGKTLSGAEMPVQVMFTFHPQRWHSKPLPWLRELFWQNVKNVVKGWIFVKSGVFSR